MDDKTGQTGAWLIDRAVPHPFLWQLVVAWLHKEQGHRFTAAQSGLVWDHLAPNRITPQRRQWLCPPGASEFLWRCFFLEGFEGGFRRQVSGQLLYGPGWLHGTSVSIGGMLVTGLSPLDDGGSLGISNVAPWTFLVRNARD